MQAETEKSKDRRGRDKQDSSRQIEMDHLADELVEVAEEMERVSRETSTLEDIEGAKSIASDVLEKYSMFQKGLNHRDQIKLEQSVGPVVQRIKKDLTLLKEAPE